MTNAFPSARALNAAALYVLTASSLALTIRQIERCSIGARDAATERDRLDLSALRRVQLVPFAGDPFSSGTDNGFAGTQTFKSRCRVQRRYPARGAETA
jgi:hypothetical protein